MAVPQVKADVALRTKPINFETMRLSSKKLSDYLHKLRHSQFTPNGERVLRKFTSGEAADLIGVNDSYLRQLALEGKGPQVEVLPNNRRMYSVDDIHAIREYLDQNGKSGRRYVKHRSGSEHLQIISCVNFKGGSGKTTTSAHLAQYLALKGYRVLAIDLDPQASLTALHGYQPEFDVGENETLYGAIRYDDSERVHPLDVIRKTYIRGLDLIPGNLELMEFEHETPTAIRADRENSKFFLRLDGVLGIVADDYDVVVIDCPPQLGFLTLAALSVSTAMVITVHPQMLDMMSMSQFLKMSSDLLEVVHNAGGNAEYDWMRYLITRFEPGDLPQSRLEAVTRKMFPDLVCSHPMVKSTAISDAGITKQTVYEVERERFSKATLDRAVNAMNKVNGEIETLINKAWGRL